MFTTNIKNLFDGTRVGDVVCYHSYGGAKTWGVVESIIKRLPRDMYGRTIENKPKIRVMEIRTTYYKSYYDKHLTGRSSGSCTIPECAKLDYPIKNCSNNT